MCISAALPSTETFLVLTGKSCSSNFSSGFVFKGSGKFIEQLFIDESSANGLNKMVRVPVSKCVRIFMRS